MKTIYTLLITLVALVLLAYIFRKPIGDQIRGTPRSDVTYYHGNVTICDQSSAEHLIGESKRISHLLTVLETKCLELLEENSRLQLDLAACKGGGTSSGPYHSPELDLKTLPRELLDDLAVYKKPIVIALQEF